MVSPASSVSPCVADMTPLHHCKYTAIIHPLPIVLRLAMAGILQLMTEGFMDRTSKLKLYQD